MILVNVVGVFQNIPSKHCHHVSVAFDHPCGSELSNARQGRRRGRLTSDPRAADLRFGIGNLLLGDLFHNAVRSPDFR